MMEQCAAACSTCPGPPRLPASSLAAHLAVKLAARVRRRWMELPPSNLRPHRPLRLRNHRLLHLLAAHAGPRLRPLRVRVLNQRAGER